MIRFYHEIFAGMNNNGNARRGYAVWEIISDESGDFHTSLVDFIEDNYHGVQQVVKKYPRIADAGRINVAPKEFNEFKTFAAKSEVMTSDEIKAATPHPFATL